MKIFEINKDLKIVCESKKTRNGFKHEATLFKDNTKLESVKICYLNRTWERYEFESVLFRAIDESIILSEGEKKASREFIKGNKENSDDLNMIGSIAKLGDLFCDNKKDKNDWKTRMVKAGLENKGLIMPDDWDSLDENTKEERLDKVIGLLGETK